MRNGLPLLALLLTACSTPSFIGDKASKNPSFIGQTAPDAPALTLSSPEDYPELQSDIDALLSAYAPPPPVNIAAPAAVSPYTPANNIAPIASPHADHTANHTPDPNDNAPDSRAHAYLKALFRGDGESAWRYATVLPNPKQSWWDSNTAKGALLIKAGSSEDLAAQKQGISRIDIPRHTIQQNGNDARLIAQITYGNGSRSDINLRLINERGQWLVAEE